MPSPVRPHRDTAPGLEGNDDPHLEFLPEEPGDALLQEPVFIIEPVSSGPSRHVAERRPQDQLLDREHVLPDVRVFLLALRGGAVGTYGVARRMTSQLAHWSWRSGARVLKGVTSIGVSGVSRCRRFAGGVIGAIERVVRIPLSALAVGRVRFPVATVTLVAFSGGTVVGASIMWLVGVLPAPPRPTDAGVTLVTEPSVTLVTEPSVTLVSGVVAAGPPAADRATVSSVQMQTSIEGNTVSKPIDLAATPVTKPIEPQEKAPSPVSAPMVVRPTAITVTSAPAGARVTVDGIGWGETPVTIRHLPPGQKVIRVTKEGYESQQRIINVADDDPRSAAVRVTLRARK